MSIPLFTDAMGYDKVLTNFDNIKQMSVEKFADFMFECGANSCHYCKYRKNCRAICKYDSMVPDTEIFKDWLVDKYE